MTESKRAMGSDLAKVDAHVIAPEEYDELPDLSADEWARKAKKPGPPKRKEAVSIRLDIDIVEKLRASGPGWQGRANDALRAFVKRRTLRTKRSAGTG